MISESPSPYGLSDKDRLEHKFFLLLLVLLTLIGLVRIWNSATGAVDLAGDEAHYWEWSRRPDLSYYSKPPGVSYLIMFGTAIFGDTALGVRIPAIMLSFLSSLMLYKLGTQLYGSKVGFVCGMSIQVVPLFTATGIGMTPDCPLTFFWILSLWFFHRALATGSPRAWLLLAASLGLGLLNKYSIAFFYIPFFAVLALVPQNRRHLRTPWPYIAFLSSWLFFLPVVIWNARHGWVTFRHDLGHAKGAEGIVFSLRFLANFLSSQLVVITPILLVLIVYAVIRRRNRDPFCFWFSIPILVIFLLESLQGKVQANWPLMGYITGLIGFSAFVVENYRGFNRRVKALVVVGVGTAVIASAMMHCPQLVMRINFPPDKNPLGKLQGWKQLGREVTVLSKNMQRPFFIFSDHYMTTSELAFYVEGHPTTYCANLGRRMNQYDIWPGFHNLVHYNAIYVGASPMPPGLIQAFEHCRRQPLVLYNERGAKLKEFQIALCYGFKGTETENPTTF